MRGDNAPSLGKAHPNLTLPPTDDSFGCIAFKFERDTGKIVSETHYVQTRCRSRQIGRRPAFAKCLQLFVAVEILRDPKAHHLGRGPEHFDQGFDVVGDQCPLVARIEFLQFGNYAGKIDFLRSYRHMKKPILKR